MLEAFLPIWALTLLGYLAGRYRLLGGADADRVLGSFVFHLAMPAALFTSLSRTHLALSGPGMLAFAASTVCVMGVGFVLSRRAFGRKAGESTIGGMAAGYVNSANLGIPVALHVLGDASFLTGVLLFQVLVVTPFVLVMLDRAADRRALHPTRLLTLPLRNPVIIGLTAGALCSAFGWRAPQVVAGPLALLGAAAVPSALVALGLSLTARGPALHGEGRQVALLSALKLVAQPLLAWAAGLVLGLGRTELFALVICAALPTAQNTYIFAREYGQGAAVARRTVVVTTAVSMGTLALVAWALG